MKKLFILLLIGCFFVSCDKFVLYSIQNSSEDELIVKAKIYDSYIDVNNRKKSLFFGIGDRKVISTDTVNNIITFVLPQNDQYDLDGCTNCELDFEFIKEINVYKRDSLVFYGNKEIIKNLYKNSEIKANRGIFYIY